MRALLIVVMMFWVMAVPAQAQVSTVKVASTYGQPDWCANLQAAIADIGPNNTGTIWVDRNAGPGSCSATAPIVITPGIHVEFIDGVIFWLSQTIQLGQNSSLHGRGGGMGPKAIAANTTILRWNGADNQPLVKFWNASHSRLADIRLDCPYAYTGCVGIHMDSNNNPPTSENIIENFTLAGVSIGIVVGLNSPSAVPLASCQSNYAQSGCSENDYLTLNNFQIYGNGALSEGMRINSLNAVQNSVISGGNIQGTNIGVRVINMNDTLRLERLNSGNVAGVNPTLFKIESSVINGPDLINNESEGGSYSVIDNSSGGSSVYMSNQWNRPIQVNGGARIVSIGNMYCHPGDWVVSGAAHVISIGDQRTDCWKATGSGSVTVLGN